MLIEVKQEVKQCDVEWEILMEKLKNVTGIIVDVSERCRTHGLEDLPPGLDTILETLRRCVLQLASFMPSWSYLRQATCMELRALFESAKR
jgi:hypothetical protein